MPMSQQSEEGNKLILKLIFALIGAMFVVMTSISGFTAAHLMDKVDTLVQSNADLKTDLAVEHEAQRQRDIRLQNIETFIYAQTGKKIQATKPE